MKEAIKPKAWCDSPYYVRELADVYIVGSRVDAWREFLLSEKLDVLRGLNMSVCSFNQYSMFDHLIIMLDCSEAEAVAGIQSIMVPGHERPVEFRRTSICDPRAWALLPLSCFAGAEGFNEWDRHGEILQSDILKFNPMPRFQIGVKKDWVVTVDCFSFSHKIKADKKPWPHERKRYAQISFSHPHLDHRFEGNLHVVSGLFPRDREISEIREELMAEAMSVCAKNAVVVESGE